MSRTKAHQEKPRVKQYRPPIRDRFEDLVALVEMDRNSISNMPFENVIVRDPEDDDPKNPTLGKVAKLEPRYFQYYNVNCFYIYCVFFQ